MARGRKPKPTDINVLEGNLGKRKLNKNEPKPNKKLPTCPNWLTDEAKKEWHRLAKEMNSIGILTNIDRAVFASYCQAYARWKETEQLIDNHGFIFLTPSKYPQQSPFISIAHQYEKQMSQCAEQLGLTPAARSRIIANNDADLLSDDMEKLLKSN